MIQYLSHEHDVFLSQRKRVTVINDKVIHDNWDLFKAGQLSAKEFIWKVADELHHGKFASEAEKVDEGIWNKDWNV